MGRPEWINLSQHRRRAFPQAECSLPWSFLIWRPHWQWRTLSLWKNRWKHSETCKTNNSYTLTGPKGWVQVHLYFSRDTSFPSISTAENSYMDLALRQSMAWAHWNEKHKWRRMKVGNGLTRYKCIMGKVQDAQEWWSTWKDESDKWEEFQISSPLFYILSAL